VITDESISDLQSRVDTSGCAAVCVTFTLCVITLVWYSERYARSLGVPKWVIGSMFSPVPCGARPRRVLNAVLAGVVPGWAADGVRRKVVELRAT
jgi:hypothetical protein